MKKLFWWMTALVLLNSCASEYVNVYFTSKSEKVFVTVDSTNLSGYTPIGFHVKRSSKDLIITARHDTVVRKFTVKSESFHYGEEAYRHPDWWYYSSPVEIDFQETPKPVTDDYVNLYIMSPQDSVYVSIDNTNLSGFTPIAFRVKRSPGDLVITALHDTMTRKVVIASLHDNSILSMFDTDSYTYSSPVTIDFKNDNRDFDFANSFKEFGFANMFTYNPNVKGDFFLKFSLPNVHHFWQNQGTGRESSFGLLGIASELGYYYKDSKYISAGFGALFNFPSEIHSSSNYLGEDDQSYGLYVDINKGFDIKRFSFSYGLSYGLYNYYETKSISYYPEYKSTIVYDIYENKLGLSLTAKYKIDNVFQVGIKYLPSYVDIYRSDYAYYNHMLFLDFIVNCDFRLTKRK
jgi:hypothetical protein